MGVDVAEISSRQVAPHGGIDPTRGGQMPAWIRGIRLQPLDLAQPESLPAVAFVAIGWGDTRSDQVALACSESTAILEELEGSAGFGEVDVTEIVEMQNGSGLERMSEEVAEVDSAGKSRLLAAQFLCQLGCA
jgi:hypothetical protein